MRFTLFLLLFCLLTSAAHAQAVKGKVVDEKGEALSGSVVIWPDRGMGTVADEKGNFRIEGEGIENATLICKLIGFQPDTLKVEGRRNIEITLKVSTLGDVKIRDKRPDGFISGVNPIKTEVITSRELEKGACCDLAGCFNTNASVQVNTTNFITNSQELRILGLSGVYNQILFDGFPLIQGLSYTYGVSGIPGPLIENIFVAKGANSVLQGFESISGQLNIIPRAPKDANRLLINGYANSFGETQLNLIHATPIGKRKEWQNLTAFHMAQPGARFDRDQDGFLDLPLLQRYSGYSKFTYRDESSWGWSSKIGLMYLDESRTGGQMDYKRKTDAGSGSIYGQSVRIRQPAIYSKTGYRFGNKTALQFFGSLLYQDQQSWYGQTRYDAQQFNAYLNVQWEQRWGESHDLKTGASLRRNLLEEDISFVENPLNKDFDGDYRKNEWIPGVFAENTFRFAEGRLIWIAGMRLDQHNTFGTQFAPRTLLRYDLKPNTTVRGSFGMGWRTVNLFSENINLLASQRNVQINGVLNPEKAMNFGLNFVHKFFGDDISGSFSTDLYQTRFQNQVFPQYDLDPTQAFVSDFTGPSISNGFQVETNIKFFERLDLKLAYNYLDVYQIRNESRVVMPFVPRHNMLAGLSWQPLSQKWQGDLNVHWYGERRLPLTDQLPAQFQRSGFSKPYAVLNLQLSKYWKKFELYGGVENLFDFRQLRPIVGWQDPFGAYFDTSSVWGPTRGREAYIGFRWKIPRAG